MNYIDLILQNKQELGEQKKKLKIRVYNDSHQHLFKHSSHFNILLTLNTFIERNNEVIQRLTELISANVT